MSAAMHYDEVLQRGLHEALEIAKKARERGFDPAPHPEIRITRDLAERVEALVGIRGIGERIRALERAGLSREEIALKIAEDFVSARFGEERRRERVVEKAVRTAIAILTEGVVSAPIEGISKVSAAMNDDGTQFIKIYYAGPIRSAGGTAQALSVLVADIVRRKLGFAAFKPREEEINRYVLEISAYDRIRGLQYTPSDEEVRMIVRNCPICIDGEPSEDAEVENFRDLERVETNKIRGGMALVICEGIALKATKILKYVERLGVEGWEWLRELAEKKAGKSTGGTFLADLIAGRPMLGKPSHKGSFRLRYGRARNTGLAAVGIHPATMALLEFLAVGTQIKPEMPGKGACVAPVDAIEGPTVKLKDGSVVSLESVEEVEALRDEIVEILDLGEILIDFGDFNENGRRLEPAAYCHEWWLLELKERLSENPEEAERLSEEFRFRKPSMREAIEIARKYGVPLHPAYTYLWEDISAEDREFLAEHIRKYGTLNKNEKGNKVLLLPKDARVKRILEDLLVPHRILRKKRFLGLFSVEEREFIAVEQPEALLHCLGIGEDFSAVEPLKTRTKAPTRVGVRMGRPEKAKERKMKPAPHSLFPLGSAGGRTRSLKEALRHKFAEVEIGVRRCTRCGNLSVFSTCEACGASLSGVSVKNRKMSVDVSQIFKEATAKIGIHEDNVKCVMGLISQNKVAEHLAKGILRAKNGVFVFKDGTIRFDMTNMPLTHFKPSEVGLSVEKARELGYTEDAEGKPLVSDSQVLELKVQDIIISESAASYLLKVAAFIDDLLERFYGLERYYKAYRKEDLLGKLVVALAPHTSAGILGRIVGFTKASVCFAHPFFHAAKRRNCDGDEDAVMLLLDALLNFSVSFLPEKRGGKMDAPLLLIPRINPKEVDKEAHNLSICKEFPLSFYEATLLRKHPKEIAGEIASASERIHEIRDAYGFKYTHETSEIASGCLKSAYKRLGTMSEKMEAQLKLAKMLKAVDEREVAEIIIRNHLLRDIKGNLRAFGTQRVRCSECNAKYRRVPLSGRCKKCGGKLLPTVYASNITKYLDISLRIAREYRVSETLLQTLELLATDVQSLFGEEDQRSLADFV
ncbi:MAG: DNA polymerase II large subunit [Candidatus Methanospirare jalkutatii]|nr:DNA polymerase II large subunit [Candidatus Methanospirare jalkutatii]